MQPGKYAKAIAGALVPAVTMYFSFRAAGPITGADWQDIVATFVASGGLVWLIPNSADAPAAPAQPPEPAAK